MKFSYFLLLAALALFCTLPACKKDLGYDPAKPVETDVKPYGLSSEGFEALHGALLRSPALLQYFGKNRYRILSIRLEDADLEKPQGDATEEAAMQQNLVAEFYDYTLKKPVGVTARVDGTKPGELSFKTLDYQPRPDLEEFNAARETLANKLGLSLFPDSLASVYYPMPPVIVGDNGNRIVTIGIHSRTDRIAPGIYGVDMVTGKFVGNLLDRYGVNFKDDEACEPPEQVNCPSGSVGQVSVTISQGSNVLWTFRALRPAASSGGPSNKGSGVELRYVRYRGKMVLYRAHLPILNVHYDKGKCGPYRDWQNAETCFDCTGTDVGSSGFRFCNSPQTIIEDGTDAGNFVGVAIEVKGLEVRFVSEMTAGWYRYISEWTFHANGTLKPRFKFAATRNNCTCNLHFHHAYWRLDFDIHTAGNNTVEELAQSGGGVLKAFQTESVAYRNQPKKWRIKNSSGNCYDIIPGPNDGDGTGDPWAKGDVWTVLYHGNELEDGVGCVTCPGTTATIQDNVFLNNESVDKQDVVVWYRASFNHSPGAAHGTETVGPDLVPGTRYWK